MRPRVFVINATVSRKNGGFQMNRDYGDAERFGTVLHLTPPGTPPGDLTAQVPGMARTLADFTPDDYLVPCGHPALIGWACALAARASGGPLKLLVWHDQSASYYEMSTILWTEPEKRDAA